MKRRFKFIGPYLVPIYAQPTIADIQARVARHYGIQDRDMVSARRGWTVSHPRQVAMYLAKRLTPHSLPMIGKRFGGRDHTTVMWALEQVEKRRREDPRLDRDIRELRQQLDGSAIDAPIVWPQ